MVKGIFNVEWAVVPPGNREAAIPLEATTNTFFRSLLNCEIRALYKYVLPVPPTKVIHIYIIIKILNYI